MTCTECSSAPAIAKGLCRTCYNHKWQTEHKEEVSEKNREYYKRRKYDIWYDNDGNHYQHPRSKKEK